MSEYFVCVGSVLFLIIAYAVFMYVAARIIFKVFEILDSIFGDGFR